MSQANAFALLSERNAHQDDNEQTRTANRIHELEDKLKLWIDPQLDGIRTALTRIRSDIPADLDSRLTLLERANEKLSSITIEILVDRIKKLEVTTEGLAIDNPEAIDHRLRLLQQAVDEIRSHLRLPVL